MTNNVFDAFMEMALAYDYSMEASMDEKEIEIYIRGIDVDIVKQLSITNEHQTQYGFFNEKTSKNTAASGHRVRETIAINVEDPENPVTTYEYTMKIRNKDGVNVEYNIDVDQDLYQGYKLTADNCMEKTRYNVPSGINNLVFQVDVFEDPTWVKIDLEFRNADENVDNETILDKLKELKIMGEEVIIVTPDDKVKKTTAATTAVNIMNRYAVKEGPFKEFE